ncbi:abortive infection family protein [Rhodococcus sp. JS3073]|uniref:abortive infection family protein n=1 Tax=Rhodococcus sp. JS3073 TaxID=3002901 RepID=UPI0022869134|nr:abortive infection family protein [Rhodococcus sp. JS3073]WAM19194.1 abortive infection family protein [Rhodococcus sp. JS3073]
MSSTLSPQTIRTLLDIFAADWSVRTIEEAFIDAGIDPVTEGLAPAESGVRRTCARQYLHSLDLTKPEDCLRVLPIFEQVLDTLTTWNDEPDPAKTRLIKQLQRDGFERLDDGTIRPAGNLTIAALPAEVVDEEVIRAHLTRLERGMEDDPAVAIGSSKELIESVCKLALKHLNEEYDDRAEIPALVKQTLKALRLHPDTVAPTAPAADTIKRILGSLSALAIGVAELRNELGTGHGRAVVHSLSARHAHLSVGAATTFARLLLETLEDPAAPWKTTTDAAAQPGQ